MTSVAIICSSLQERHSALCRSIETWLAACRYSDDVDHFDICVTADGYTEDLSWPKVMNLHKQYTHEPSGSHITAYNYWYNYIDADVYIFTHPDLLFPRDTVMAAIEHAKDNVFVAFKCFWMSPDMTRDINKFDWINPETLEQEPMLFELDELLKGSFYANRTARDIKTWESSTTYAVNKFTADRIYPIPDLGHQGYDDPYQLGLRSLLGISNYTVQNPMLFHQWHPNTWKGTGEDAVREAAQLLDQRRNKK